MCNHANAWRRARCDPASVCACVRARAYLSRTWRWFFPGSRTHSSSFLSPSSCMGWSRVSATSPFTAKESLHTVDGDWQGTVWIMWSDSCCQCFVSVLSPASHWSDRRPMIEALRCCFQSAGHQVHTPRGGAFTAYAEGGGERSLTLNQTQC